MVLSKRRILRSGPVVCAVGRSYQIMVPVNCETLMRVTVGEKDYFCHSNGVRRTDCPVQSFTVPMDQLNTAGEYTLHYQRVISRMPYACVKSRTLSRTYSFRPLQKRSDIHAYILSDTHGLFQEAVAAGSYYQDELDLLILNGDISSSCMKLEEAMLPFDIAYEITKGSVPCVITRGNHDLRGKYSERLHELMPSREGKTYYEVCLGPLWLLVLDCGEDKNDDHREYGGTAAYHTMREEETVYLKALCRSPDAGFRDPQVRYRVVVSHIPVPYRDRGADGSSHPFDIENELYTEWLEEINAHIKPDLYIAGHLHRNELWQTVSGKIGRPIACPVLITGKPVHKGDRDCICAAVGFSDRGGSIAFTDKRRAVLARETVTFTEEKHL